MSLRSLEDEDFERFRKARKRAQPRPGLVTAEQEFAGEALRELQQVERRELRDKKLTREVHDFFATAMARAKSIVERVSRDAEAEVAQRVAKDMEAFLVDALTRTNSFLVKMMRDQRGQVTETEVEPSIGNIVGRMLDEFRFAGTAAVGGKHVGQDPFQTDVDEVQREFKSRIGTMRRDDGQGVVPIDQPAVALIELEDGEDTMSDDEPAPLTAPIVPEAMLPPASVPGSRPTAVAPVATEADAQEMERFRDALKTLVRQGQMTRAEALAAWQVKIETRGGR